MTGVHDNQLRPNAQCDCYVAAATDEDVGRNKRTCIGLAVWVCNDVPCVFVRFSFIPPTITNAVTTGHDRAPRTNHLAYFMSRMTVSGVCVLGERAETLRYARVAHSSVLCAAVRMPRFRASVNCESVASTPRKYTYIHMKSARVRKTDVQDTTDYITHTNNLLIFRSDGMMMNSRASHPIIQLLH